MAQSTPVRPGIAGAPRARLRTRQACTPCRKRRRKCDGDLPCGQCSFYEYDCVFDRTESGSFTRRTNGQNPYRKEQTMTREHPAGGASQSDEMRSRISPGSNNDALQVGLVTAHPANRDGAMGGDPITGGFDERKGRYCGPHSAIVFPHLVRTRVASSSHLRLHSYGWNVNLRSEPQPPGWSSIRRVITYQEIETYSSIFFEAMGGVYELFDASSYHERTRLYWASRTDPSPDFEALVAGVVALGSLFAREGSMAELQLVEHAKTILDIGCSYAPGRLSIDQGAAWVLRTVYLRSTTRPHLAWFASCASMHVAEALGLHLEQATSTSDANNARLRILHCALLINGIISAEYGRSRVHIDMPRGNVPDTVPSSDKLALAQALFALEKPLVGTDRSQSLERIAQLQTSHSVLQLHKVDIAMHWYRRGVHGHANLIPAEHKVLIDLLSEGLSHVPSILASGYPWSNVLSTPFQSLLVLLSIDSDESLALVPEALKCLQGVADTFRVSLATEALEAAQNLVKALKQQKLTQAHYLRDGDGLSSANDADAPDMAVTIPPPGDILLGGTMDNWLEMFDLDGDNSLAWGSSAELN